VVFFDLKKEKKKENDKGGMNCRRGWQFLDEGSRKPNFLTKTDKEK